MPHFTARPTTYKGIPMRSRLEAHWAAWFDIKGVEWEYEPRAFANERGQYLPDFLLPPCGLRTCPIYFEVKPTLEAAYAVLPRMEIILESDPGAVLEVAANNEAIVLLRMSSDRTWRVLPGVRVGPA